MQPTILFEDDALLVLDKPAGLQVIPDKNTERETLTAWLAEKYGEYHIVHRLDRDTSGVLVVAKTEDVHAALKKQFQDREIKKTYRAFVHGSPSERGIINKPIGSSRGGAGPRSAHMPYGKLREAHTVYRRIKQGKGAAYVEVFPKTGRMHQIRVHFSAIGHPVVGDRQYAPGRPEILGFPRHALHALSLTFVHPVSRKEMTFKAPLPPDFVAAEGQL